MCIRDSAAAAAELSAAGVQVLHVTGLGKEFVPDLTSSPGGAPYVVLQYADRMDLAYAAADLVAVSYTHLDGYKRQAHRGGRPV